MTIINSTQPLLLNRREAAKALAISERKLWDLTARGDLPQIRIDKCVRYELTAIQSFIERQRQGGAA